ATTFVADVAGVYVAALTAGDFVGPGEPSIATITVASPMAYAETRAHEVATEILALTSGEITSTGNQNAMLQFVSHAVQALQAGDASAARRDLEQVLSRTDGCGRQGIPDGNGPGRDWIVSCDAQGRVYPALAAALSAIEP